MLPPDTAATSGGQINSGQEFGKHGPSQRDAMAEVGQPRRRLGADLVSLDPDGAARCQASISVLEAKSSEHLTSCQLVLLPNVALVNGTQPTRRGAGSL